MSSEYVKRIAWLGISIQKGTADVPDDDRYHVLNGSQVVHSTPNRTIAQAHLEVLADEVKASNPRLVDPREILQREQAFRDILAARGEARQRARAKHEAKGGKGGRSGV